MHDENDSMNTLIRADWMATTGHRMASPGRLLIRRLRRRARRYLDARTYRMAICSALTAHRPRPVSVGPLYVDGVLLESYAKPLAMRACWCRTRFDYVAVPHGD
jgi:hypothetical protein